MKNRKLWIGLSLALVILIAAMIFFFSAQNADDSSLLSGALTRSMLELLVPGFGTWTPARQLSWIKTWGHALRKVAHVLEYALLGASLFAFLRLRMRQWPQRRSRLAAWLAATLYAGTDELHQLFVSGRGPGLADVVLDSAGALAGALLASLCLCLILRKKSEKEGRESAR